MIEIPEVRCFYHEDEDPGGYYYLTVELHNGFAIQVSLCKATGQVRCELWNERNSITPDSTEKEGLRITPYEFLEWRDVACGREPREYFGAHWRATHKGKIEAARAEPALTVAEAEARWEKIRQEEAAKTPEQKAADREIQRAKDAAQEAAWKAEIEEQVRALKADGRMRDE